MGWMPAMPVLTRFGDITSPNLAEGPKLGLSVNRVEPLWISWEPGDGDYMVFSLTPGTGTLTKFAKLRCVTMDDGCLQIPGSALGHLALQGQPETQQLLRQGRAVGTAIGLQDRHLVLEVTDIVALRQSADDLCLPRLAGHLGRFASGGSRVVAGGCPAGGADGQQQYDTQRQPAR